MIQNSLGSGKNDNQDTQDRYGKEDKKDKQDEHEKVQKFDEPVSLDFQSQNCPVKDENGNCLVSGIFRDSEPIGGA